MSEWEMLLLMHHYTYQQHKHFPTSAYARIISRSKAMWGLARCARSIHSLARHLEQILPHIPSGIMDGKSPNPEDAWTLPVSPLNTHKSVGPGGERGAPFPDFTTSRPSRNSGSNRNQGGLGGRVFVVLGEAAARHTPVRPSDGRDPPQSSSRHQACRYGMPTKQMGMSQSTNTRLLSFFPCLKCCCYQQRSVQLQPPAIGP